MGSENDGIFEGVRRERGRENVLVVSCWFFGFQVFRVECTAALW